MRVISRYNQNVKLKTNSWRTTPTPHTLSTVTAWQNDVKKFGTFGNVFFGVATWDRRVKYRDIHKGTSTSTITKGTITSTRTSTRSSSTSTTTKSTSTSTSTKDTNTSTTTGTSTRSSSRSRNNVLTLQVRVQVQVFETNCQEQPTYPLWQRQTVANARKFKLKHETCGLLV